MVKTKNNILKYVLISTFALVLALSGLFASNNIMSVYAMSGIDYIGYVDSTSYWYNGNVLLGYVNFTTNNGFELDETYSVYRYNCETNTIDYENTNVLVFNSNNSIYCAYSNGVVTDNWFNLGLAIVKDNTTYYIKANKLYFNELGYQSGYSDAYNPAYNDGYNAGADSVDTDSYYSNGFNDGKNSVDTNSYIEQGKTIGYELGYADGIADVDTDNYYNNGYSAGYNAGVNAGTITALGKDVCTWAELDLLNNEEYANYYNLGILLNNNRFNYADKDLELYAQGYADYYYSCGFHYNCCADKNVAYLFGYLDGAYEDGFADGKNVGSGETTCTWDELDLLNDPTYLAEYNAGAEFGINKYNLSENDAKLYAQGYADYSCSTGFHYGCCSENNFYYLRGYLDNFYDDAYENGKIANYYEAFEQGYLAGETYGYKNGYEIGNEDGTNAGYDKGYTDGYNEAVNKETYDIEKFWNENKIALISSFGVIIILATIIIIAKKRR